MGREREQTTYQAGKISPKGFHPALILLAARTRSVFLPHGLPRHHVLRPLAVWTLSILADVMQYHLFFLSLCWSPSLTTPDPFPLTVVNQSMFIIIDAPLLVPLV
jgi:hypothetical protein